MKLDKNFLIQENNSNDKEIFATEESIEGEEPTFRKLSKKPYKWIRVSTADIHSSGSENDYNEKETITMREMTYKPNTTDYAAN